MPLQQDVIDRILIAKDLMNRVRFVPGARPDNHIKGTFEHTMN